MSTGEHQSETSVAEPETETGATTPPAPEGEPEAPAKPRLALDVKIEDVGPCKKRVKVAIPRSDVEKQFKDSLGEMTREAHVPGFRPGHAPKGLVEKRFRKEMANQVKSTLLMTSLEQLDDDYKLNPITQPDLDVAAIELPDDGPMCFEMEVEVRPDFPLPHYKGLTVKRPTRTITEADVDDQYKTHLERRAQLVPKLEGGAEPGDFVTADVTFHRDGAVLNEAKLVQFRLQDELRFQDGRIDDLVGPLTGARPGDSRETVGLMGSSSPDPRLRNQTVGITFHVQDLKTLRLPEADAEFFRSSGFDDVADLRRALRGMLERRLEYQSREAVRREIVTQLVDQTPFDLPADLVGRQEKATVRRQIHELKESGLADSEIRAREAELRANAHESTLRGLKEFFILAKIADAEKIEVGEEDLEQEIQSIAARGDDSPRRVRARVERDGLADALLSQILEQKAIEHILAHTTIEDVAMPADRSVETIDETVGTATEPEAETETETETEAKAEVEGSGEPASA